MGLFNYEKSLSFKISLIFYSLINDKAILCLL